MSWSIRYLEDPLVDSLDSLDKKRAQWSAVDSRLAHATLSVDKLLDSTQLVEPDDVNTVRVAVADFIARRNNAANFVSVQDSDLCAKVQPLDHPIRLKKNGSKFSPFILQRSDVWCSHVELNVMVRVIVYGKQKQDSNYANFEVVNKLAESTTDKFFSEHLAPASFYQEMMGHVACALLQQRARKALRQMDAVAFVANGAILPRRSGASSQPMSSPPAVPFEAPCNSEMSRDIVLDLGAWASHISGPGVHCTGNTVTLAGLAIPSGITLICGGGYHGKSTLLRTIASGVYNKVPGDGREFCVAVEDAVSVRAEDGRYVNNCNISAFISNLPTPPGVSSAPDTSHFSSKEASGSTSQAANVAEAIEMGAKALLVDEDVSAANFMARDGRMRALVMDESITPLLYRVNGLYQHHGVSSIVVVGGVGDWLDVQDKVVLMDKYVASDATAKARSISYQFSYGHVQYAGRGVVHRLPWEKSGTPVSRRPSDVSCRQFDEKVSISIMDGGGAVLLSNDDEMESDNGKELDEHVGLIDLSRCEQLFGKKAQLYGCALCVKWILQLAEKEPALNISELLTKLDETLDAGNGMLPLFAGSDALRTTVEDSAAWKIMVETLGCAIRPRKHEVFMALTRMRGIVLEDLPIEDDGAEAEAAREEERKKRALAEMWNSRRKGKLAYG